MAFRGGFAGNRMKNRIILGALCTAGILVWGGFNASDFISQGKQFLFPEISVEERWEDSYNSVLVKDLLRKAEFVGEKQFTREELRQYRTGQWYFSEVSAEDVDYWLQGMDQR